MAGETPITDELWQMFTERQRDPSLALAIAKERMQGIERDLQTERAARLAAEEKLDRLESIHSLAMERLEADTALVHGLQQRAQAAEQSAREMAKALKPFADEWEIADEAGELAHWPETEAIRCKAAYDALNAAREGK